MTAARGGSASGGRRGTGGRPGGGAKNAVGKTTAGKSGKGGKGAQTPTGKSGKRAPAPREQAGKGSGKPSGKQSVAGQKRTANSGTAARAFQQRTAGKRAGTQRAAAGRPPAAPVITTDVHVADGVRLQKVLAQAGVASRRASEEMIAAGRVTVDGQVVTELGVRVDPANVVVHVDGMRLQLDTTRVYLALNKPRGVVSTMSDPEGRPCVGDLVSDRTERLFHVGRLDVDTEGLLLLTNDGDLAHRLQHPSYGIAKTYLAEIPGPVPRDLGRRLRAGVDLEDGVVSVDSFRMIDSKPGRALVEVVLHEGRNHIVRRLLAEVGHPVLQLVRTRIGPVTLGDLLPGKNRTLSRDELGELMSEAGM